MPPDPGPDLTTGARTPAPVRAWHDLVAAPSEDRLREILAPDVVFHSPAVHTPQEGADRTFAYLWAALQVLGPTLEYRHVWTDESSAVLRFTAVVGDKDVSGVDILRWNADGRLVEFTVMVRPLKALQALVVAMGAQLAVQGG